MIASYSVILTLVVLFICLLYLSTKHQQRNILLARFHILSHPSPASIPAPHPPSLDDKTVYAETPPDYKDVFPPSVRDALRESHDYLPDAVKGIFDDEPIRKPHKAHKCLMPFDLPLKGLPKSVYTPTGFSIEEIRNLGDFPDYAALSGVPLPQPYKGFDIDKALPRPYRPLRWAYHQTMCMQCPSACEIWSIDSRDDSSS